MWDLKEENELAALRAGKYFWQRGQCVQRHDDLISDSIHYKESSFLKKLLELENKLTKVKLNKVAGDRINTQRITIFSDKKSNCNKKQYTKYSE